VIRQELRNPEIHAIGFTSAPASLCMHPRLSITLELGVFSQWANVNQKFVQEPIWSTGGCFLLARASSKLPLLTEDKRC
jgi:hypothetical protein